MALHKPILDLNTYLLCLGGLAPFARANPLSVRSTGAVSNSLTQANPKDPGCRRRIGSLLL